MLHVSDLQKFKQCPINYYWSQTKPHQRYFQYVHLSEPISDLMIKKLQITNPYIGQRGDSVKRLQNQLDNFEWFLNARIEWDGLRGKVPALHKTKTGWDFYYFYVGTTPRDNIKFKLTGILWLLKQLKFKIDHIFIIYFNHEYLKNGNLDYQALMTVSDHLKNRKGNPQSETIMEQITKENLQEIGDLLKQVKEVVSQQSVQGQLSTYCFQTQPCDYLSQCFGDETIPNDSILHLVGNNIKYEMIEKGYTKLEDYLKMDQEITRQQFAQIMASKKGGLHFEKLPIKLWLKELSSPISFLDFEWDTSAIPDKDGERPFEPRLFQYSIHFIDDNQSLQHQEYLSFDCDEKQFINQLLQDLPPQGSIITFNGDGAESRRLAELAVKHPEYEGQLQAIIDRLKDISVLFTLGYIYDLKMAGSYSLKSIVKAISDQPLYQELEINHGLIAVEKWRELETLDKQEKEQMTQQLLAYCAMDTYALFVLYQWILNKIDTSM